MTLKRYRCSGCNLFFTCDLEPTEICYCPLCGHGKPALVDELQIVLCADCSITIKANAIRCPGCGRPLCDVCGHIGDACRKCRRGDADGEALEDLPPRTDRIM